MAGSCESHESCWKDYFTGGPSSKSDKRPPARIILCENCNHTFSPSSLPEPVFSLQHARQNYAALSTDDAESIRAFLDKVQNELLPYDSEISRLRGLIMGIQAQKTQLTKSVSLHRSKSDTSRVPPKEEPRPEIIICNNCNYTFTLLPEPFSVLDACRNRAPLSSQDKEILHTFLEDAQDELLRCYNEICRLENLIKRITGQKSEITKSVALHRSMLSPIRQIPAEILSLVFSFCCDVGFWDVKHFEEKIDSKLRGVVSTEPFAISAVCRYWRDLALSIPQLWTTVMLVDGYYLWSRDNWYWERLEEQYDDAYEAGWPTTDVETEWAVQDSISDLIFPDDVLELVLRRSAQQPLKVWLDCGDRAEWLYGLNSACSRIQHLHIFGPYDPFCNKDEFSALTALDIHAYTPLHGSGEVDFRWVASATKLRQLVLRCDSPSELERIDYNHFLENVVSEAVEFVAIQDSKVSRAAFILSTFPQLKSSSLFLTQQQIPRDLPIAPLDLTHINLSVGEVDLSSEAIVQPPFHPQCSCTLESTNLKQCSCTYDHLKHIFSTLNLPALQSLQVQHAAAGSIAWPLEEFSLFMQRSELSDKLRSISLHDITVNNEALIQTLQLTPNLTSLTISDASGEPIVTTTVIRRIPSLLPLLTSLDLCIHNRSDWVDAIGQLLESASTQATLEKLCLRVFTCNHTSLARFRVRIGPTPGIKYITTIRIKHDGGHLLRMENWLTGPAQDAVDPDLSLQTSWIPWHL
ncbi:hypothetical protein C8J56DRAFT_93202 [Mycena floridula]|nr:hypothetical protein C8J56DRAFT_93202 [Mycena floridula]